MNFSNTTFSGSNIDLSFNIVTSILNLALILPTNIYVMWLIVNGERASITTDCFALNLSMIMVLYCLLFGVYASLVTTQPTVWKILAFSSGLLYVGQPLFQCCICVERYLAVVHPVVFMKYKLLRYKVACSGLVWLIVLGVTMVYKYYPALISYCITGSFLPMFSLKLFLCLAVLRALKRPGPGEGDREREGTNNIKMRAFKVILVNVIAMGFYYIPMTVTTFFSENPDLFFISFAISLCTMMLSSFVQPAMYLHRAGKLVWFHHLCRLR